MFETHFRRVVLCRVLALVLIVGGGLAVAACDSSGANSGPDSIEGDWQATIETDSVTYDLTFQLEFRGQQSRSWMVGDGEFAAGEESWTFQIPNGRYFEPVLNLTLRFDATFDGRRLPITIQGDVGEDFREISAEISGGPPQFDERRITITRP